MYLLTKQGTEAQGFFKTQLLIHPIRSQAGVEAAGCSTGCGATWLIAEPGQKGVA